MKVQVVPASGGKSKRLQFLISTLVNGSVAIDAGALGLMPLSAQRRVQHVFLSHAHLDHVATLPIFLDNVYEPIPECVAIYGSRVTFESLQQSVFNDHLWPDLVRLSAGAAPFLRFVEIDAGAPIEVDGVTITPVALDHTIPVLGFIVDDGRSAVAIVSDTAPTDEVWRVAAANPRLRAVFLEASFPESMSELAQTTKHLTPRKFAGEFSKLGRPLPVYAVHIKPAMYETVVAELQSLQIESLQVAQPGRTYRF